VSALAPSISNALLPPHACMPGCCWQVIFPLDFEKTEQSERFMKTVETVIRERPDCINPAVNIPSPADRAGLASAGDGQAAGGVSGFRV